MGFFFPYSPVDKWVIISIEGFASCPPLFFIGAVQHDSFTNGFFGKNRNVPYFIHALEPHGLKTQERS